MKIKFNNDIIDFDYVTWININPSEVIFVHTLKGIFSIYKKNCYNKEWTIGSLNYYILEDRDFDSFVIALESLASIEYKAAQ